MGLTQSEMAARMGLSMSYIHQLEAGKRTPSDSVLTLVGMLEVQLSSGLLTEPDGSYDAGRTNPRPHVSLQTIPVVSWAHAGEASAYDELPADWQDRVPTECRDPKAFGVWLEGDSMEPKFSDGDLLVLQPSETAHSGSLVVARFKDDGVIFRRYEITGQTVTLVPLNNRYHASQHSLEDFSWIYPVWGRWTQIWRR